MQLGMIGLGRMGANMVRRLLAGGHHCVVFDRDPTATASLIEHGAHAAQSLPELVRALVVEDMAPDFRGRTTGPWEPWVHALPVEFTSADQVYAEFGPVAGQYFLEAFDRTATGWRLHGHPARWIEIAAEWGTRDYWSQWEAVTAPTLLIEAGNSVTPPGQMRAMAQRSRGAEYLHVPGAGHLVHDDAPGKYRDAVEAFLSSFA